MIVAETQTRSSASNQEIDNFRFFPDIFAA